MLLFKGGSMLTSVGPSRQLNVSTHPLFLPNVLIFRVSWWGELMNLAFNESLDTQLPLCLHL